MLLQEAQAYRLLCKSHSAGFCGILYCDMMKKPCGGMPQGFCYAIGKTAS